MKEDPFAGRRPRDFFAGATPGAGVANGWPTGGFRPLLSREAAQLPAGPDRTRSLEQAKAAEDSVRGLAQLVKDLNQWMAEGRLTQEGAADQLGVTPQRLSRLRNGEGWPKWDLVILLQAKLAGFQRTRMERELRHEFEAEMRQRRDRA